VALKDRDAFGVEVGRRPFRNLSQEALVLLDVEGPRVLRAALQQGCNHANRLDRRMPFLEQPTPTLTDWKEPQAKLQPK
jgi:hypothetical protein